MEERSFREMSLEITFHRSKERTIRRRENNNIGEISLEKVIEFEWYNLIKYISNLSCQIILSIAICFT